jgi:lycopene cyclase domain-containing protein
MRYEYLLFNLLILFGPLVSVLLYKKIILPEFRPASLAILISAIIFGLIDIFVTGWFWFFNPKYVIGIYLLNVPLEEFMFFFTVPSACLLIWVNLSKFNILEKEIKFRFAHLFAVLFPAIIISGLSGWYYTLAVVVGYIFLVYIDQNLFNQLTRKLKYYVFSFSVLVLTFFFNLYLTFRPIVLYYPEVRSGINVITIPIEDFLFGAALMTLVLIIYEKSKSIIIKAQHNIE